jgi:cytochrome P450
VQIPPFIANHLHVDSYAEIKEIMESPKFLQGRSPERDLFFGQSIVMTDGPLHHERKRRFAILFTKKALFHYENELMEPVIRQTLSELGVTSGRETRTDLVPLVRIMLHRISATVTGIDKVDTPEATERFRLLLERLAEAAAGQWAIKDREALTQSGLKAKKELIDDFMRPSLDRRMALVKEFREGRIQRDELPLDVMTVLCLDEPESLADLSDDAYVWRECTMFVTASTQTTTHQLPHVVTHVAEWVTSHPDDGGRLADPEFLRLAVNESLRLHQTAPVKTRIAAEDVTLSSGRVIREGEVVALFAPNANKEPEIFGADAKAFNPYREKPDGAPPWGLTFGAGPHSCLGKHLVTGLFNRTDKSTGAEGTMVKILTILYGSGMRLDPADPPERISSSFHDAYARMPIILERNSS